VFQDKKYSSEKYKDIYTELSIVKAKADCDINKLREKLVAATEALGELDAEGRGVTAGYGERFKDMIHEKWQFSRHLTTLVFSAWLCFFHSAQKGTIIQRLMLENYICNFQFNYRKYDLHRLKLNRLLIICIELF